MSSIYASIGFLGAFAFTGMLIVLLFIFYGLTISITQARRDYIDAAEDESSNPHQDVIDMQIAHPIESEIGIEHREMRIDRLKE